MYNLTRQSVRRAYAMVLQDTWLFNGTVQAAMRKLMSDKTCFVIAHRLSTIRNADRILVVNGGNIVEQGTHEDLMKLHGFYYKLYASQFE